MGSIEITKENFTSVIDQNDIVVVDFWAPWCGPCRAFKPVFEKVADDNEGCVFGSCNTEEQPELATVLQIRAIPTLMVFREHLLLYRESGALPEAAFRELVQRVKEVDMDEVRREVQEAEASAEEEDEELSGENEGSVGHA